MAGVFVRFFLSGGHGRWTVRVLRTPLSSDAAWPESCWQLSAGSSKHFIVLGLLSSLTVSRIWRWDRTHGSLGTDV